MSVRHALLALLSEGPKYGLQLRDEFEARTGEVWPLNVGQVYTTLQRLERDALVEWDGGDGGDGGDSAEQTGPQKHFRITAAGISELETWLRTPSDTTPPRDELVIKVLVALRVPGVNAADLVQVHRRHLIELMQRYTRLKEGATDDDLALTLVADAEIYRLDGVIRWLDSADARLKRRPAPTPMAPTIEPEPAAAPSARLPQPGARR
jgi:DNA-binding PadR family transcriptional regulator